MKIVTTTELERGGPFIRAEITDNNGNVLADGIDSRYSEPPDYKPSVERAVLSALRSLECKLRDARKHAVECGLISEPVSTLDA